MATLYIDTQQEIFLPFSPSPNHFLSNLRILNQNRSQPLWILDIHRLDIAVKLLLCPFLIIPLARNPYP